LVAAVPSLGMKGVLKLTVSANTLSEEVDGCTPRTPLVDVLLSSSIAYILGKGVRTDETDMNYPCTLQVAR
jgi:hypothetical protein